MNMSQVEGNQVASRMKLDTAGGHPERASKEGTADTLPMGEAAPGR